MVRIYGLSCRQNAKLFVDRAEALFCLAPLEHLSLWGQWDTDDLDPYDFGWPQPLPQISDPIGLSTLSTLIQKPCFRTLRSLNLFGNGIGDEGARLLLSAEYLSDSCKLSVRNNGISSDMMLALRVRYPAMAERGKVRWINDQKSYASIDLESGVSSYSFSQRTNTDAEVFATLSVGDRVAFDVEDSASYGHGAEAKNVVKIS
jgi:cold shock CspA family protein